MSSTFSRPQRVSLRVHPGHWTAAAIFVIGASACHKDTPSMQAPQITVAPAIERVVADWDEFTGHFEAVNSVEVRPRVGGFLQRVGFTEGAIVHQGDVLFVSDQRPYEAEVARGGGARPGAHAQSARRYGSRARAEAREQPGDLPRGAGRAHERPR